MEYATIIAVNLVTSFFKKNIYPKWGKTGVQFILLVASALAAVVWSLAKNFFLWEEFLNQIIGIFAISMAVYEVLLSKFDLFKGKKSIKI